MVGRGQWLRNKQTHDQRTPFYAEKPKKINPDVATSWIPEYLQELEGLTTPLTVNSILTLELGPTPKDREVRLRQLSRMGYLRMSSVWKNTPDNQGEFSHFEWTVT